MCTYAPDPCRAAHCSSGECRPQDGPLCDDGNQCTQDICNVNVCEHKPLANGTACDDQDPCTVGEACASGECVGGAPRDCDDHNECTEDSCDLGQGCVHTPVQDGTSCFEGLNRCRPGTCQAGVCEGAKDLDCDDQDPCTKDSCDPGYGCRNEPVSGPSCEDGDACTVGDRCATGQCVPGQKKVCDDENACTADSCDPKKGCVFTPIVPCCGNRVVEAGEECDGGLSGTDGCGQDCRFRLVTLAQPPAGGRLPAFAWSDLAQSGLLAYEWVTPHRVVTVRTVGTDLAIGDAQKVWTYQSGAVRGLDVVASPDGPSDFLVAAVHSTSVDLFALDANGALVKKVEGAWTPWDPTLWWGRVRAAAVAPGRFLVVWADASYCAGSKFVPVARAGYVDVAKGTVEPAVQVGSGSCDPWEPTLLIDLCGAGGRGMFVVGARKSSPSKVTSVQAVPWTAQGLGEPVEVSVAPGEVVFGGLCAATGEGGPYLFVYWEPDPAAGGLRLRSILMSHEFGTIAGPWTLEAVSGDLSEGDLCLPLLGGGAVRLPDGRFLLACPQPTFPDMVGSRLAWRLLDADGQGLGDWVLIEVPTEPFALDARIGLGPRSDLALTWYETGTLSGLEAKEPGWLRFLMVGKAGF